MRVPEGSRHPDRVWLEQLFGAHYEELCAFVYSIVFSDDVAEDLVQDLFVSIWQDSERWARSGDALRPLLFIAARNRALDQLRHRRVRERHAERVAAEHAEPTAPAADAELLEHLVQREIDDAVASLPERARAIFLLSRDEGLTYREIAERLGISVKTVENQMNRSLKKLRARLAAFLTLLLALLIG